MSVRAIAREKRIPDNSSVAYGTPTLDADSSVGNTKRPTI